MPTFHQSEGVTALFIRKLAAEGWSPIFTLGQGAGFYHTYRDVKLTLYARGDDELILETYWGDDGYRVWRAGPEECGESS
jgi:hypothetical protein